MKIKVYVLWIVAFTLALAAVGNTGMTVFLCAIGRATRADFWFTVGGAIAGGVGFASSVLSLALAFRGAGEGEKERRVLCAAFLVVFACFAFCFALTVALLLP